MPWSGVLISSFVSRARAHVQARYNHERAAGYRELEFIAFKSYGDASKPPLVIIPGLDGATAFFSDVIPELTLNVSVRDGT